MNVQGVVGVSVRWGVCVFFDCLVWVFFFSPNHCLLLQSIFVTPNVTRWQPDEPRCANYISFAGTSFSTFHQLYMLGN